MRPLLPTRAVPHRCSTPSGANLGAPPHTQPVSISRIEPSGTADQGPQELNAPVVSKSRMSHPSFAASHAIFQRRLETRAAPVSDLGDLAAQVSCESSRTIEGIPSSKSVPCFHEAAPSPPEILLLRVSEIQRKPRVNESVRLDIPPFDPRTSILFLFSCVRCPNGLLHLALFFQKAPSED